MSEPIHVNDLLGKLRATDPSCRDLAAAELGDLIEADCLRGKDLRRVVNTLIEAAVVEKEPVARESLFNALSSASAIPQTKSANWDALFSSPTRLDADCQEHSLVILGFLQEPRYRAKVEPYLNDPSERIRLAARDALALLDSPPHNIRGKGEAV